MTLQEFKESLKNSKLGEKIGDDWEDIENNLDELYSTEFSKVLTNKNAILEEKKKLQADYEQFKSKAEPIMGLGITPESFQEMQKKLKEFEERGNDDPDMKELQKQFYNQGKQTAEAELSPRLQELQAKLEESTSKQKEVFERYIDTLKEQKVNEVLAELHVKSLPTWKRGFLADAEVSYDEMENKVEVKVPDPKNPKQKVPLEDWKKLFPLSEEGKSMIQAPQNFGSGAGGGSGSGSKNQSLTEMMSGMFKGN